MPLLSLFQSDIIKLRDKSIKDNVFYVSYVIVLSLFKTMQGALVRRCPVFLSSSGKTLYLP